MYTVYLILFIGFLAFLDLALWWFFVPDSVDYIKSITPGSGFRFAARHFFS